MSSADHTLPRFDLPAFAEEPVSPALVGGRYRLLSKTGAGSSAVVYRALDLVTEQDVAVKLFHAGIAGRDFLRREREFRVLADLRHPGLVEFRDSGFDLDRAYLVMRLVEGPTVAGRILCGPLSVTETARLGAGVAEALAYVHSRGITHRDLKPANILLAEDRPLLTDFGLAHRLGSSDLTASGAVVGTAAYMAPEQVRGKEVGPPADIYALGLILLECLTGYREYPGAMVESALARLSRTPEIPEFVPPALALLLTHMTAEPPDTRPTATQIATELATILGTAALTAADEATIFLPALGVADTPNPISVDDHSADALAQVSGPMQVDAPTTVLNRPGTSTTAFNQVETSAAAETKQLPVREPRRRRRKVLMSAVVPVAGVAVAGIFALNSGTPGLPATHAPANTPTPPTAPAPATPVATATLVPIGDDQHPADHPTGGSQHQGQDQATDKESKAKPTQAKPNNQPNAKKGKGRN
ncbi:serine/threonine-protein kinase [Amycolatopsis sp. YIM 10]|uniref:serine/threonine-protein kinase n=1 Tax=Amycolatopsis sp. YIM 10 TaxID=2653857 RepID=UPI0012A8832D|nr:serine/threonine-protein kinase [Amycolatopsis sp. YIM 10]QFU87609.1 Serine/threonine-protein kinase PrkC [Amycolatopsis sp. YIM 10]